MAGSLASASNLQVGYAFFRVTLGLNMFLHGFMRIITGLSAWEATQAQLFVNAPLPMPLVHAFLYALPFIETVIGALLILGLFTRETLIAGAIMIFILVFGTGVRQEWGTVGAQMLYVLYYYLMIVRLEDNWLALDNRRARIA
jgi:thiosulfate dehydrogenase [quinone] large subunit